MSNDFVYYLNQICGFDMFTSLLMSNLHFVYNSVLDSNSTDLFTEIFSDVTLYDQVDVYYIKFLKWWKGGDVNV